MNQHDFFPTGESTVVPGRVISLHQVLGVELGMLESKEPAQFGQFVDQPRSSSPQLFTWAEPPLSCFT